MIYLDYNATTPLHPDVLEAMRPFLAESFGNASSVHRAGARGRAAVEEARRAVAATVGAEVREILFTSGGTESNNWALFGAVRRGAGAHLVISPTEHASVLEPVRELERSGVRVTWLPVDGEGRVDLAALDAAIEPATVLVSIGWANGEIGTIQPVAELARVCRRRAVLFHVDAVQALGKLPVDVAGIDLCSLSAHKIGGPQGAGALFVREGVEIRPLLLGGHQERGLRAGTENVAALVGFGAAVRRGVAAGVESLREALWNGLTVLGGVHRNSPGRGCLPNTLNVAFDGLRGEALVAALDLEGVGVSAGSACAAGAAEPSHVLLAVGQDAERARDGVRFSLGAATTAADIARVTEILRRVVHRMRGERATDLPGTGRGRAEVQAGSPGAFRQAAGTGE